MYEVKDLASMTGVSIRTLHYYDEVGLLKPASVGDSGYRYYTEPELKILEHIIVLKEIGFSIKDIESILSSPNFNFTQALLIHKELLLKKKKKLDEIIITAEKMIQTNKEKETLNRGEMFNCFKTIDVKTYLKLYTT